MQKRSILASILLMILVAGISGCMGGQKAQEDPTTTFVPTGTKGVTVQFVQDQPPVRSYTGTPISVLAEVKNEGTYDIQSVDVRLTGYDPSILPFDKNGVARITQLEGKSTFNPFGETDTVEFKTNNVQLPQGTPSYKPTLMLTSCYHYQTVATPMACIDPNPQYRAEDKACTVSNLQTGGSQGAPIAVTSVEAQSTPSDMIFRIHISNVGGGQVYDKSKVTNCDTQLQYGDLNKIHYSMPTLGGNNVQAKDCNPSSPLRLVDGKATLFCKFAQSGKPAYLTPLRITLDYGYKNSVQKQIEIQNLNT